MNILIVGATSGIGNKLWHYYSSNNNKVLAFGRRLEELDKMAAAAPDNTIPLQGDIADLNSFNKSFNDIINKLNTIDLAIVCASIGELNPDLDIPTELATLQVNVQGWTNCVDIIYKHFEKQGHGHLVTITSIGGLQASPVAPSYSASKAFQINYTKSLLNKAKGSDIIVTEVRPGLVDTRMAKGDGLFWVMPLEKVTASIIKSIKKKHKRVIIDCRWRIINYILKHFM